MMTKKDKQFLENLRELHLCLVLGGKSCARREFLNDYHMAFISG